MNDKQTLIDRADAIVKLVSDMNVSYSSPRFPMATTGLAGLARGDMKRLVLDMKEYIERDES